MNILDYEWWPVLSMKFGKIKKQLKLLMTKFLCHEELQDEFLKNYIVFNTNKLVENYLVLYVSLVYHLIW